MAKLSNPLGFLSGGRVNGASPAYNVEEMTHALKTAKSKVLITLPSSLDVALDAARHAGIPQSNVLLLQGSKQGFTSIQQLMDIGAQSTPPAPYRIPKGKTNAQVCGYLNFSSGTTGLPKAVSTHLVVSAGGHKGIDLTVCFSPSNDMVDAS